MPLLFRLRFLLLLWMIRAAAQQTPEQVLAKAIELHQASDFRAAIRLYQDYLKSGRPSLDAYTNYGAALAHESRYEEAISFYQQALQLKSDHPPALLNLALAYYKTGRSFEARQQFETVRPLIPPNIQLLLLLADCNVRLGDNRRAIELLTPVEEQRPNDMAVAYVLGTALIRDKQVERGSKIIDRILRKGDSPEAHLLIGTAKFNVNDFAGAREDFRRATELNPELPDAHAYLGLALINVGEVAAARSAFAKELEVNPANFTALLQLGVLAKQAQRYDEARSLLDRALRVRPGDVAVRYQLATVDHSSGKLETACQALEAIVRETPQFREAHVSLATVYYKLKRKEDGNRERALVRQLEEAEREMQSPTAAK
ncbi:MAG: tetratricopeptide repeat protein [Acidobacteriota bacterium]|nr:tetratricopeptide repeat protein [Acidobacteriota bacterium]